MTTAAVVIRKVCEVGRRAVFARRRRPRSLRPERRAPNKRNAFHAFLTWAEPYMPKTPYRPAPKNKPAPRPAPTALASRIRTLSARLLTAKNEATDEEVTAALDLILAVGSAVVAAESAPQTVKGTPSAAQARELVKTVSEWASQALATLGDAPASEPATEPTEPAPADAPAAAMTSREFGRLSDTARREFLARGGQIASTYKNPLRKR